MTIRLVLAALLLVVARADAREGRACATTLAACTAQHPWGCARAGSAEARANELKRSQTSARAGTPVSFADFRALQVLAERVPVVRAAVSARRPVPTGARGQLERLGRGGIGEGTVVQFEGFIVGRVHGSGGESVNCNLKDQSRGEPLNNDIHVTLAEVSPAGGRGSRDPRATVWNGVVVELIPEGRPRSWTLAALRDVQRRGWRLRVVGRLFFDSQHRLADSPPGPGETLRDPPRMSLWEVHPVSAIYVCPNTDGQCGRELRDGWQPL